MFRGLAQLVARLLWEQDAVGSSPASPTKKCRAIGGTGEDVTATIAVALGIKHAAEEPGETK